MKYIVSVSPYTVEDFPCKDFEDPSFKDHIWPVRSFANYSEALDFADSLEITNFVFSDSENDNLININWF